MVGNIFLSNKGWTIVPTTNIKGEGMEEEKMKCSVKNCENLRESYAENDHDVLSPVCSYHGETEEGQKEFLNQSNHENHF